LRKLLKAISNYIKLIDKWLIFLALSCSAFGIVLIYSATNNTLLGERNVTVQLFCLLFGFILMLLISKFDFELYEDIAKYIFIVFIVALIVTYFVATEVKGNRNWINFGLINLQTSEIAKFAFIITMSVHISKLDENLNEFKNILFVLLHFLAYIIPILIQGDVGSALIYLAMFTVMLFIGGLKLRYFAGATVVLVASSGFIWNSLLMDYMKNRIISTFNPELDPLKTGYQAIQSKIAIGSGKMWGNGLFNGIQTQYNLLPEKHTDFIFSVAGEELGFVGCSLIILLLTLLIFRIVRNGSRSKNNLGTIICFGVAAMLGAQMLENIGMCIGFLPVIGITLPLFSYGGSSLISVFICLGLVLNVASQKTGINFKDEI